VASIDCESAVRAITRFPPGVGVAVLRAGCAKDVAGAANLEVHLGEVKTTWTQRAGPAAELDALLRAPAPAIGPS